MSKKAILYCRVSTDDQAEHGYGLVRQTQECTKYAQYNDIEVVDTILDDCSGTTLDRPGLSNLRRRLDNNEADTVIVHDIDRLSRDAIDYLVLRREWMNAGIEIHYAVSGVDTDDFYGLLNHGVRGFIKHGENDQRKRYTMKGRVDKAKAGKPVLMGQPPYGYRKIGERRDAYLEIDKYESRVVKLIFKWYVYGDESGEPLSMHKITEKLNDPKNGYPPPAHKNRIAKAWYAETIRKILLNETYIGMMYYGKTKIVNKKRIYPPRSEWIPIPVPEYAFIDEDIFLAAGERIKINIKTSKRNRKYQYLLSGHVRCGNCGLSLHGLTEGRFAPRRRYYRCTSAVKPHRSCVSRSRVVSADDLEKAVWEWLVNLLTDDYTLEVGLRELVERQESAIELKIRDLHNLESLIQDFDIRIKRLTIEMSNHEPGIILDTLRDEIISLGHQRQAAKKDYDALFVEVQQVRIDDETQKRIKEMARIIRERINFVSYKDKRWILDILKVMVTIYRNGDDIRFEVSCAIPLEDEELIASCTSSNTAATSR